MRRIAVVLQATTVLYMALSLGKDAHNTTTFFHTFFLGLFSVQSVTCLVAANYIVEKMPFPSPLLPLLGGRAGSEK